VKEIWEDETTGAGAPGEGKSGGEWGNGLWNAETERCYRKGPTTDKSCLPLELEW
jgi:hypothetical protein